MNQLTDILFIYLIVVLIWLVVAAFSLFSIIKRKDLLLPVKIFWCAVIVAAPVLGLIVYLIYQYNKEQKA